jgi:hypothetical protein
MSADLSLALNQVERIRLLCDFLEVQQLKRVPVTMPPTLEARGFDISLWLGLGMVGIGSAMHAYIERVGIAKSPCFRCGMKCLASCLIANGVQATRLQLAAYEIDDVRHLFAHNFDGHADGRYFVRTRHVLIAGKPARLSSGARFDGINLRLDIPHLRYYSEHADEILRSLS